jgi:colanic acid biosynthesis glycosyl transferase WcaI
MSPTVLIDYGCHYFTYRLATRLSEMGTPMRYFANGSLESPNLASLAGWVRQYPEVVQRIECRQPYGKINLRERLRGELEWAGHCVRALEETTPSAIVVSCVPMTAVTKIQAWALRRGVPFIYWLQDIQGRAIHDLLGRKLGLPGKALGAFALLWEQQMLERSRMVITIARSHESELPDSVRTEGRYALLENWAEVEDFPLLPTANSWSARHGLDRTRNILYSGTLGLKHDLNVFTALAEHFRDEPDVRVVIVSSGQAAASVEKLAAARGLSNLVVLPFQPQSEVPQVLASASVLIAPLDSSAGQFCVPSKILAYLCAGRPIVLAIDESNLAAETIHRAGAGAVVPPGDTAAFVREAAALLGNDPAHGVTGCRARAFAEQNFSGHTICRRFLQILDRSASFKQGSARPLTTLSAAPGS